MKRNEFIKQAILEAVKTLNREKPGWVYTRTALRHTAGRRLGIYIEPAEFQNALADLKKEKKIHSVIAYKK